MFLSRPSAANRDASVATVLADTASPVSSTLLFSSSSMACVAIVTFSVTTAVAAETVVKPLASSLAATVMLPD